LSYSNALPHLSVRVSHFVDKTNARVSQFRIRPAHQFMGPTGTFKSYSFGDLLRGKIPAENSRTALLFLRFVTWSAHRSDAARSDDVGRTFCQRGIQFHAFKWIRIIPLWLNFFYVFLILLLSLWIIFRYPQSVAFVFLGFLSLAVTVFSAALFDLQTIWLPVSATLATILASYVVISSYRLSESENFDGNPKGAALPERSRVSEE